MTALRKATKYWWKLALLSGHGRVQVSNIKYEFKLRSIAKSTIEEFFDHLEINYDHRYGEDPARDTALSYSCLGAISDFMSRRRPAIYLVCPPIKKRSFDRRIGASKACRFLRQSNAIRHYALHSNVCRQVDRRRATGDPSAAADLLISDMGIAASARYRSDLVTTATATYGSDNRAVFLTFEAALRPKPKHRRSVSNATWACYQVGLLEPAGGEPMVKLEFNLSAQDKRRAHRPSIFASGGYAAFSANDHRDGFGRTQRLDVNRAIGIPEFIYSQANHPKVYRGELVGLLNPATDGMDVSDYIIQRLDKASK